MSLSYPARLLALSVSVLTLGVGAVAAGEVVWWTPNWGEARAKELVEKFQAANPGITIRMEITVSDGLPQRVLTALSSGAAPDIIEVQHPWVNSYAQNGLVLPLDDTIQDKDDFNQAALSSVTWDGKIWAIPYRIETRALIYNRADFVAAGLDPDHPPQTWTELADAAAKVTATGKAGYAIVGGGEVSNIITSSLPFLWMNGGNIVSDDVKTATVNQPAAIEAITYYTDFFKNKISPSSTLENDGNANRRLFIADSVAAYLGGQFDIPTIQKENPNIDVGVMMIPHPEGKETAAVLAGWSYIIPKDAKNPDDAKKFLQFLNTSENQGFFTDTFPARTSSQSQPRFDAPILSQFKAMLSHGRPVPTHKNWVQITQAYYDGIQRILLGEQTVQESMDQANDEIQALLDS